MKYFNKLMVFFVLMLFGYGVDTFTYDYKITNQTGGDVKVQLYGLFGKLNRQAELIESGSTFKFDGESDRARCRTKKLKSEKKECLDKLKSERARKAGLCLAKIGVWTKNSAGKWRAKVTLLCRSGNYVLKKVSGKIIAVFE